MVKNYKFLGTYQVQTDPLFCNAIIAYDPTQYCVFGFVWIWWIESNGDDLLPTALTTDNFDEHSRMRYFYHDFWKKTYFLVSWKGIIIKFFMLAKELVHEPFTVKNFRKQQDNGVSVIDLH